MYFMAFALWMLAIVLVSAGAIWFAIITGAVGIAFFIRGAIKEENSYAD